VKHQTILASYHIKKDRIIAYPTEGVFGLGCKPGSISAVKKILRIKQRASNKGLILISDQIEKFYGFIDDALDLNDLMSFTNWPGPYTLIVKSGPKAHPLITGGRDKIAIRVTDHPVASGICQLLNFPIVSTSANISNRPSATSALQVRKIFKKNIDYIVGKKVGKLGHATAIYDYETKKIIRNG